MKESLNKNNKKYSKELIIGLGETSVKKNYYPELKNKILELEGINARTRAFVEAVPDMLIVCNKYDELDVLNKSTYSKYAHIECMLETEKSRKLILKSVRKARKIKSIVENSFSILCEGEKHYFEMRSRQTEAGEVLIIIRDITKRVALEKSLREAAEKDNLTGLNNRWSYENRVAELLEDEIGDIALVLIDIDGLKIVNDTLGHLIGDKLIKITADVIDYVFAENSFISRVGGDEFAVLIDNTDYTYVEKMIHTLKHEVEISNKQDNPFNISISFGYYIGQKDEISAEMLFQQADNLMYQNKLLNSASAKNNLVRSLMKALEAKDFVTEGHVERLDKHAHLIGESLDLSSAQMDQLELLAKFHDIGKVGIPDAILNKPSRLSESEFKVMQTHTQIGERIAKESGELNGIAHLILKHHEQWDGNGYPIGLSGNDIPIECRIISIVDAYDAMTNDRPYRKAMSKKKAINEIKNCSGSQFDPYLVEVFLDIINF